MTAGGFSLRLNHTHTPHQQSSIDLVPVHVRIVSVLQVEGVGLYFRQQLLQSRHRGAFELAYVGFVRLTDMLCRCVLALRSKS